MRLGNLSDRARPTRRVLTGFVVGALAIALIATVAMAASPARQRDKNAFGEHPGCHGTANAYSHVLANRDTDPEARQSLDDLRAVAEKKGCDLTGVEPAQHPNRDKPDQNADGEGGQAGPPAVVVEAKCDRIADKLAVAQARTHGNSADAFARQAEKWSCPD